MNIIEEEVKLDRRRSSRRGSMMSHRSEVLIQQSIITPPDILNSNLSEIQYSLYRGIEGQIK